MSSKTKGDTMQQGTLSLQNVIEQVSREKGIDSTILVEATEQAILTAAKRTFGTNRELEARFNRDTGAVDLFQYMTVVELAQDGEREISLESARKHGLDAQVGEELGFQVFYLVEDTDKARQQDTEFGDLLKLEQHRKGFGRIAAQMAKQVILQRVRDAERERVFNEYKSRKGELITGAVRRFDRGASIIVDLDQGRTEAVLPAKEQTPRESYRPGDRIVALIKDVDRDARGPQIILSRSDVGLMVKLFEMEVPEIYEGIVRIVAASREAGARSKIAVTSRDSDVDPVGACVGMKGSRVQAVVQELRGEKIDIVPWDRDPAHFVCNAIAPAEVVRVIIDEVGHSMELVVPDVKLSLAIGRRGQNVRLASQLTGWKLEIISESRFREIEESALTALMRVEGVDATLAKTLYRNGFRSLDELVDAKDEELVGLPGVGDPSRLRQAASSAMEAMRGERLVQAAHTSEPLGAKDRMLLLRDLGKHTVDELEQGGYRTVESIAAENDVDRLAMRAKVTAKRAEEIRQAARTFLEQEEPKIREGQKRAATEASLHAENPSADTERHLDAEQHQDEKTADNDAG